MTAIRLNTTSLTPLVLARRPRDCNMIYFNVTLEEKSRCEFLSGSKLVMPPRVINFDIFLCFGADLS